MMLKEVKKENHWRGDEIAPKLLETMSGRGVTQGRRKREQKTDFDLEKNHVVATVHLSDQ